MAKRRETRRAPKKFGALIQVVTTPEFKFRLESEARGLGRTLSGHIRWLLENRPLTAQTQ